MRNYNLLPPLLPKKVIKNFTRYKLSLRPCLTIIIKISCLSFYRIMYYSDWHHSNPKIESMYMDGTNRKYIISSDVSAPSGLAIDKIEQRLYWCDMHLDTIESSNLDGTNRRVLFDHYNYDPTIPLESVTGEIQLPYGLTLHQEKVFWTDWRRRAVYSADKRIGSTINYITRVSQKPMQVHAYSKKLLKG